MGDPPEKPPAGAPRVDDFPAVGRPGEVPKLRGSADLFQLLLPAAGDEVRVRSIRVQTLGGPR